MTLSKSHTNLSKRLITAAVGGPILLLIILFFPTKLFAMAMILVAMVGFNEYLSMALKKDQFPLLSFFALMGMLWGGVVYFAPPRLQLPALAFVMLLSVIIPMVTTKDVEQTYRDISRGILGIVYLGFLLAFIPKLHTDLGSDGPYWVIFLLTIIWLGDTGAYFAGRALGKHHLAPSLSPKKTWEGAFGGFIATVLGAQLARLILLPELPILDCFLIAAPASVLAQLGDLFESLFKRATNTKDSGTILHGHGGLLDRIDGVLFAAPYVYFYATGHFSLGLVS